LRWQERVLLGWMAPRGIVAAAVAAIFALRLSQEGHARASELVSVTFLVIVGTVTVYGLTAAPLARWLGVSTPNPQGVLFLGAHALARALAKALQKEGVTVLLADTNWENLAAARLDGLPTYYGNVLAEHARDELDLGGIGKMLALTANGEVNTLAAMHFIEFFGRQGIFQVALAEEKSKKTALQAQGRLLFGPGVTFQDLSRRVASGETVRKTPLTEEFGYEAWRQQTGGESTPLFVLTSGGVLKVFSVDDELSPGPGDAVIALGKPPASARQGGA